MNTNDQLPAIQDDLLATITGGQRNGGPSGGDGNEDPEATGNASVRTGLLAGVAVGLAPPR